MAHPKASSSVLQQPGEAEWDQPVMIRSICCRNKDGTPLCTMTRTRNRGVYFGCLNSRHWRAVPAGQAGIERVPHGYVINSRASATANITGRHSSLSEGTLQRRGIQAKFARRLGSQVRRIVARHDPNRRHRDIASTFRTSRTSTMSSLPTAAG
jgi:hypothetical protein